MKRRGRPPHPDVLTPREWEVLELVREGLSNEQIAERLGITLRTARYHVSEILSKLGVTSRADAAAWRPEPRRRWLRALVSLPGAAKVAGAAVVLAAFAGLGVLLWGVLSTGGTADEADATTGLTPAEIVQRSLDAMQELDSFSVEFRAEGSDGAPSSSGKRRTGFTAGNRAGGRQK